MNLNMAKSKKDTRSSVTTAKFQLKEYKAIDTYETKLKLPSGQYLLGRMIHLCQPVSKGENKSVRMMLVRLSHLKYVMIGYQRTSTH